MYRRCQDDKFGTLGDLNIITCDLPEERVEELDNPAHVAAWNGFAPQNVFSCHTLEKPWVDVNDDGVSDRNVSRIPRGVFRLARDDAGRFVDAYRKNWGHTFVPMVKDGEIPGRSQILFHTGNDVDDTAGCILVGEAADTATVPWKIINSREVYKTFYTVFEKFNPEYILINQHWEGEAGGDV